MIRKTTIIAVLLAALGVAARAAVALDGPFISRLVRLDPSRPTPPGFDYKIETTTEAIEVNEGVTGGPGDYNIAGRHYRISEVVNGHRTAVIDFAGFPATFDADNPYPNGVSDCYMDFFLVFTRARVTVPPGIWQIAFGSDDGGFLKLAGATITDKFNENGGPSADDEVLWEVYRKPGWTGGRITAGALQTYTLSSLFFEEGGGDNFEIAVRDASGGDNNTVSPANGWQLLQDGQFGWGVAPIPEPSTLILLGMGAAGLVSYAWRANLAGRTGRTC